MKLTIINGPNLNLLGRREPGIYGTSTFSDFLEDLCRRNPDIEISYFQSNSEGELVDRIQHDGFDPEIKGIVLNPGAYSHYSIAIADAIAAIPAPVVEVHISNIFAREEFRHHSVVSPVAKGCIAGLGFEGYALAINYLRTL